MSAIPTLPPILRMRLKTLVAFPIFSGEMRDMAGQRKDWFSSQYIRTFAVLCVFGLVALIIRELMTDHPVVDLRVLRNRSFSAGVFLISLLGFVLYASLVLSPLYLPTLLGYPAYNSGLALSPRGIGALLFR